MPIRRSPNGASYTPPQPGRDRPEWVVAINRNAWSQSIGISGRNQPVRARILCFSIRSMAASTSSVGLTSSGDGPEKNAPALIGAGMMGDRADIIFADASAISAFIAAKCE
jgi:hypothetical protein